MAPYALHKPATYDLTGMSQVQFEALREALLLLHQRPLDKDPYSDDFERERLAKIAASELIDATNGAVRQAEGTEE